MEAVLLKGSRDRTSIEFQVGDITDKPRKDLKYLDIAIKFTVHVT